MNQLPYLVGILNITPDSFSGDGVLMTNYKLQITNVIQNMIDHGADIIDVGAESTAPGSQEISVEEELQRLQDVFEVSKNMLRQAQYDKLVFSIDTMNAFTAKKAIKSGFTMVNDVSGGRKDTDMFSFIAGSGVKYVMMYSNNAEGRVNTKNDQNSYTKIIQFFDEQIEKAFQSGIKKEQLILDPGMGAFISMNPMDSVEVLQKIPELKQRYGLPLYIGASRKGFLSKLTSYDFGPKSRIGSSLAAALFAAQQGADYIRVHDILETRQVLDVYTTLQKSF